MTLIIIAAIIVNQKYKNFKRFLKVGDKVDWYRGEVRQTYTLERIKNGAAEIRNDNGYIRKVPVSELYPNIWFHYGL